MKIKEVNNKWFFASPPVWMRFLLIYILGDSIVLIPFIVLIIIIAFIHVKLGLIILGLYISIRELGEMIYWLLQQFGKREYRPSDFGFKYIDNNGIYVLYQLMSLVGTVIGLTLLIGVILYMN